MSKSLLNVKLSACLLYWSQILTSLQPFHTFQLDHYSKSLKYLEDITDFNQLVGLKNTQDFIFLGSGSNCLFLQDTHLPVFINRYIGKTLTEHNDYYEIRVNGGEDWHEFVMWCVENGIDGLENLALIPGTVGAAPIQNIGAYGREVKEFITSIDYLDLVDGTVKTVSKDDCKFSYRNSIFKNELKTSSIILTVVFRITKAWQAVTTYGELSKLDSPSAKDILKKVCDVRRQKLPDPKELGNAGSFFKNPILNNVFVDQLVQQYPNMPVYDQHDGTSKVAAGWLIDQCKLKGFNNTNVGVHKNQALVLVNLSGNSQGKDLVDIAEQVIAQVEQQFSITLEPEVRFYSENGEVTFNDIAFKETGFKKT